MLGVPVEDEQHGENCGEDGGDDDVEKLEGRCEARDVVGQHHGDITTLKIRVWKKTRKICQKSEKTNISRIVVNFIVLFFSDNKIFFTDSTGCS